MDSYPNKYFLDQPTQEEIDLDDVYNLEKTARLEAYDRDNREGAK